MTSNQYQLTTQIHQNLPKVCKKYGLEELEIESEFYYTGEGENYFYYNFDYPKEKLKNCIPKPQSPQIRQILIHLQEVLGENPEHIKCDLKLGKPSYDLDDMVKSYNEGFSAGRNQIKTRAEALCQKWLVGLTPLFDTNPEQVLTELNEVLENLLK
jgi:hypothetical protein